jgi:RHS repeat-associated protein
MHQIRTSLTFANGAVQAFTYDPILRLASLTNNLTGTANDLTVSPIAYNPASQITTRPASNDAYIYPKTAVSETGVANGLNQLTTYAAKSLSHDSKGNVTAFGSDGYGYSSENLLTAGPASTTLAYDPLLRLYQTVSGATTSRFVYDGLAILAEYNASNALQRRWVYDDAGQPVLWYEGSGTTATSRRYLSADERGSVIAVSDSNGASLGINKYDEYGQPAAANVGRFGYTGQAWLPSVGLWYYKARMYRPDEGGRFMQTDPIDVAGGINLYAYVGNDPVNWIDPLGLASATDRQAVRPTDEFLDELIKEFVRSMFEANYGDIIVQGCHSYQTGIYPHCVANIPEFSNGVGTRGPAEGGATGSGGPSAAPAQQQQRVKAKPFTCADAMIESGKVRATGVTVTAVLGLGWTVTRGSWVNLSTNTSGKFTTVGFAAGLEAGGHFSIMTYSNIGAFTSFSDGYSAGVSVPVGPMAVGGSYSHSSNDSGSGSGGSLGVSPGDPFPSAGACCSL